MPQCKKSISLVINARVQSTRVSNKLIRKFSGTTLLEISLDKLSLFTEFDCYLAAADDEIIEIYNKKYSNSCIKFIQRNKESVKKGYNDYGVAFAHYGNIPTSNIMWINPCSPFVKISTYKDAISHFMNNDVLTMTSVKASNNMFIDKSFSPININGDQVRSVQNDKIYEMSHLFHFFDKNYFLKNGSFWDYTDNNPKFYEVSKEESFDVDDPLDFVVAEALYEKYGPVIGTEI